MAKIVLFFVGKLGNSSLLPAFPASTSPILSHFPFVAVLCKGLKLNYIAIFIAFYSKYKNLFYI